MIGVIATLKVKEGGAEGFEAVFRDLSEEVRRNELDNVAYDIFRSRSEPNTYKVLEIYRDEAALQAHRDSEHFKRIVPRMGEFRTGTPEVEYLDGID